MVLDLKIQFVCVLYSEPLVCYGLPEDLKRQDLISLDLDSDMSPAVVDHWAKLLNHLESEKTDKVDALYFGLTHMVRFLSPFFRFVIPLI